VRTEQELQLNLERTRIRAVLAKTEQLVTKGPIDALKVCAYKMRMNRTQSAGTKRLANTRPTNLSLNASLVDEAKALGVNVSLAATSGLEQAVAKRRAERWIEENESALQSYNAYIEQNGLPLGRFRPF
jgi:antitoxin CcdA